MSIVSLNVGGRIFCTSLSNLTESEAAKESFLGTLVRSSLDTQATFPLERDEQGRLFIDRNPDTFEFLLQYVREGLVQPSESMKRMCISAIAKRPEMLEMLLSDAAFFGFKELQDNLLLRLERKYASVQLSVHLMEHLPSQKQANIKHIPPMFKVGCFVHGIILSSLPSYSPHACIEWEMLCGIRSVLSAEVLNLVQNGWTVESDIHSSNGLSRTVTLHKWELNEA